MHRKTIGTSVHCIFVYNCTTLHLTAASTVCFCVIFQKHIPHIPTYTHTLCVERNPKKKCLFLKYTIEEKKKKCKHPSRRNESTGTEGFIMRCKYTKRITFFLFFVFKMVCVYFYSLFK